VIYIVGYPVLKFADDTKIFNGIKDKSDCAMPQQDLNTLQNWATKWEMSFNASRCKVMHIGKQLGSWEQVRANTS